MFESALLDFVVADVEGYVSAARRLHAEGVRTLVFRPFDSLASAVAAAIRQAGIPFEEFLLDDPVPGPTPPGFRVRSPGESFDAAFLFDREEVLLSDALLGYLDWPVSVVAPITRHYYKKRGCFVATIPKAGTHLLYQLFSEFDIRSAGTFAGEVAPQHWHFLSNGNSHTTAEEFFRIISSDERGGAAHAVFTSPLLFIYRNPLDILVSESHYYRQPGKTALAHYFKNLSDDERLLTLIADHPLLHSIRDRVRPYVPWAALDNVIALSYEELVGLEGSGSLASVLKTVWSLQLKLHVPGRPAVYARTLFNRDSPTFTSGRINSHRSVFKPEHWEAFRQLPQDFMTALGYDVDDRFDAGYLPRFVDRFRRRPLKFASRVGKRSEPAESATPFADGDLLEYGGYHVACLRRRYWAVPRGSRSVDVWRDRAVPHLHTATSLDRLAAVIAADPLDAGRTWQRVAGLEPGDVFVTDPAPPELVLERYKGYNVVFFSRRYYALRRALGEVELDFVRPHGIDGLLVAETLEDAKHQIDREAAR